MAISKLNSIFHFKQIFLNLKRFPILTKNTLSKNCYKVLWSRWRKRNAKTKNMAPKRKPSSPMYIGESLNPRNDEFPILERLRERLQDVGIRSIFCWGDKESEGFWLKQVICGLEKVNEVSTTIFVAREEEDTEEAMRAAKKGIRTFSSEWFMNCVMRQELDLEAPQFAESL